MGKNSAEYMRAYRARKKAERHDEEMAWINRPTLRIARERVSELEEEVRRLKAELANRPIASALIMALDEGAFAGRMRATGMEAQVQTALSAKAQQASRDAILRKINRGG